MTEAERVYHKTGNGETRISPSLKYISEFDFRELNHKTRIFGTRISCFPTHLPELFSRDFLNSNMYQYLISNVKSMYKGILLEPAEVKVGHERIFAGVMQVMTQYPEG